MATYEECLEQILKVSKPFSKQNTTIQEDTEFVAELGLNSLQIMEMVEQIEDHFDIAIPINILPGVRTVKDLCQHLETITNS